MKSVDFEGSNARYGPPVGLAESQVAPIRAFHAQVLQGPLEGSRIIVTAWQPSPEELAQLNAGNPVFLTFIGSLPPHLVTTNFAEACSVG